MIWKKWRKCTMDSLSVIRKIFIIRGLSWTICMIGSWDLIGFLPAATSWSVILSAGIRMIKSTRLNSWWQENQYTRWSTRILHSSILTEMRIVCGHFSLQSDISRQRTWWKITNGQSVMFPWPTKRLCQCSGHRSLPCFRMAILHMRILQGHW